MVFHRSFDMELKWIIKASYLKDYILNITFNDGVNKDIDFEPIIKARKKLFGEILNLEKFKQFKLNDWTVSWLDGKLDLAPEYLYQL